MATANELAHPARLCPLQSSTNQSPTSGYTHFGGYFGVHAVPQAPIERPPYELSQGGLDVEAAGFLDYCHNYCK